MLPPARAMILAAGLGTRLRPLTDELPKPLVPVGDRSVLAHIAERLAAAGIEEAVLNTHHLAEAFTRERLGRLPIRVAVVNEPSILGTAGGLANAAPLLGEGDVVVWNGDILADVDVGALLAARRARGDAATLAIAPRARGEGTVGLGEDGRVVRLRGERFGEEAAGGDFLGIHAVGEALRGRLPRQGCMAGDVYLPALRRGERLGSLAVPGAWDDIGSLGAYLSANARWLDRSGRTRFLGEGVEIGPGVTVEHSVVGEGARLGGEGAVRGAVIWPGARASAPIEGAVATSLGAVVTSSGFVVRA
jgi:mannose-1-phosphate guanylyltransferase